MKIPLVILFAISAPAMVLVAPPSTTAPAADPGQATTRDSAALIAAINSAVQSEMAAKGVPSMAVALVDRNGVFWSSAWGHSDEAGKIRATPANVYRAGSVSKLFTDLAVMRLVEAGKIDLDAPVARYLPDFHPHNPFGTPITLRGLMTHRAGLVREPPRGNYFDPDAKGQADAVRSLNDTTLAVAPATVTKYSNAGVAVVGEVLARVSGMPYEQAVEKLVLAPIGMRSSGMSRTPFRDRVAYAEMASFDGPRFAAPAIDPGTIAAGNLYTTVGDLGKFVQVMLNHGVMKDGPLVQPSTLDEMWRRQFPVEGSRAFGLGFVLSELDGQRTVGHTGAIYGFQTDLRILPDTDLGVVVFNTVDAGNSASKIAEFALRATLAARQGKALPAFQTTEAVTGADAKRLSGWFSDGKASVATRVFDGHLVLDAPTVAGEVRRAGSQYLIDDAQTFSKDLAFAPDASWIEMNGVRYTRQIQAEPPLPAADFASLIGEYGWEHNILRIYQRDGLPYARIEWVDYQALRRVDADHYAFPANQGLFRLETLSFERDPAGAAVAVSINGIRFPRRDFGAETQDHIRASVKENIDRIRADALEASPPSEPPAAKPSDIVALQSMDPTIKLDIRYATTNNFIGVPFYEKAGAFMQRPAAEAVARANQSLRASGYGLLIHDGYRPWFVTKMFWDMTPPSSRIFVANPASGSRHNRGAAVDLTLYRLSDGKTVEMIGRYDEMSTRSYSNYVGGSDHDRWLRELLRSKIEAQGFDVYAQEWWHFDFANWHDYAVGNASFSKLDRNSGRP